MFEFPTVALEYVLVQDDCAGNPSRIRIFTKEDGDSLNDLRAMARKHRFRPQDSQSRQSLPPLRLFALSSCLDYIFYRT